MNENAFWVSFWGLFFVLISVIAVCVTVTTIKNDRLVNAATINQAKLVAEAIAAGVDPIAVKCAYSKAGADANLCVALTVGRR